MAMKKILSVLLSAALLSLGFGALAEETLETLTGRIVEVLEDGSFLVQRLDEDAPQVKVLLTEDTFFEAEWTIGLDDVIIAAYDGEMTDGTPPEITALACRSYSLEGPVTEADDESGRVLIDTASLGAVYATLPAGSKPSDFEEKMVRIYTDGMMALSYPGQVTALSVQEIFMETGTITVIEETFFLMDWAGSQLQVNFGEQTKVVNAYGVGTTVAVYYNGMMTRSLPGQIMALVIAGEETLQAN